MKSGHAHQEHELAMEPVQDDVQARCLDRLAHLVHKWPAQKPGAMILFAQSVHGSPFVEP